MKKKMIEEIYEQLRISSTGAVMRSQLIADRLGINPTDLETIEVLFREGKTTAGTIAKHTGLTTGAVTGIIDRLVKAGFAAREFDQSDRRKVLVVLNTQEVTKRIVPLYESLTDSMDKVLNSYSMKQLQTIIDFLKKSNSVSEKDLEKLGKSK